MQPLQKLKDFNGDKNGHDMVLGEEKQNIEIVYTKQYLFHLTVG